MSKYLVGAGLSDYAVKSYNGGGSSFTMDNPGTTNSTLLTIDGVDQVAGTDFTVSGAIVTTTSSTPSGTNNVTTVQMGRTGLINVPADSSVTSGKLSSEIISGQTEVTIAAGDSIMLGDVGDSNNLKRDTVQGILDLVPSAGLTLLETQTASTSATIDLETTLNSTYENYVITLSNVLPVDDDAVLGIQVKVSSYLTSGYQFSTQQIWSGATNGETDSTSAPRMDMGPTSGGEGQSNTADDAGRGTVTFAYPDGTANHKMFDWHYTYVSKTSSWTVSAVGGGSQTGSVGAITGVRFLFDSGSISTGIFKLYGVVKS